MASKVIVLSKNPATIMNIYNIDIDDKILPTERRKDKRFQEYYDLIWNMLDENE